MLNRTIERYIYIYIILAREYRTGPVLTHKRWVDVPLSITDDTATLSRTVNRLATKKQKRGERKLEKHGPLHGMRPRFAAHARGKYEERSPIVSIREKFNPVARGSPPTSPRCYTLYRSSTALVIWLPGWRINTSCRDIVSRFRKSIANTCASAWPDRVPTIRFVFLPGPDLPPHLASPPSLARPPNRRTENREILF